MTEDRLVGREQQEKENMTLRPQGLDDFIGQDKLKKNLKIFIKAAQQRGEPIDHVLFSGPPGLGKTTLAGIVAKEMGVNFKVTSGPIIERQGDLAAIITSMQEYDVLFIDEIHRINRAVEEILYSAMEEFKLDIVIGKGPSAQSIRIDLPKFTLVGATTRKGLLTAPLRDRFGISQNLEFYDCKNLKKIIKRASKVLNAEITETGAEEISRRSRGTPRIAIRLLKRVRDFAQVENNGIITADIANKALISLSIDKKGLDSLDKKIVLSIIEKYSGGPVGIDTISASLGEEKDTISEVYEPYLIQIGFIKRTSRGREATRLAYEHYKKEISKKVFKKEFIQREFKVD